MTLTSQTMVTVMPPCGLPGFGGGTSAQSFSRFHLYSLEADTSSSSAMQQPFPQPHPFQQHQHQQQQSHLSRGKFIQNQSYASAAAYPGGKNIYNGYNESRIRTSGSVGKQMSQRDTRPTSSTSNPAVKSRGKNMLNYTTSSSSNAGPVQATSQIRKAKGGKVMPPLQQLQQQQQPSEVVQNGKNFAQSSALSNSSPSTSVAVIPSSSSSLSTSSLGSSSSGMTKQDWSGQEDMSRGEGGPPRVRYPAGGHATSKPLFVDCSVEYELPKMAKIPPDSLPLLMIHPKWQNNKPITRSNSQQNLHLQQQQQLQQVLQGAPHQFHVMPQQQQPQQQQQQQQQQQPQQPVYLNSCPQCPIPATATSGRGRKRPLMPDFQPQEDSSRVKRTCHDNTGEHRSKNPTVVQRGVQLRHVSLNAINLGREGKGGKLRTNENIDLSHVQLIHKLTDRQTWSIFPGQLQLKHPSASFRCLRS